jgi:hypothetical protein
LRLKVVFAISLFEFEDKANIGIKLFLITLIFSIDTEASVYAYLCVLPSKKHSLFSIGFLACNA